VNLLTGITNTSGYFLAPGQVVYDNTNPTYLTSPTTITTVNSPTNVTLSLNAVSSSIGDTFTIVPTLPQISFLGGIQISNPITIPGTGVAVVVQNGINGIQVGDTITIAGITYTAGTTENIPGKVFQSIRTRNASTEHC
jgi:hypothetical protein